MFCLFQEKKLEDEINQLNREIKGQDDYIKGRKDDAAKLEALISGYRQSYNQYKVDRDKLHDERKYGFCFSYFNLIAFTGCERCMSEAHGELLIIRICWNIIWVIEL